MSDVTQARRLAHDYWFGFFGAHSDPRSRLICIGAALAFLVFPVADLLGGANSRGSEVAAAAGLAAFAALFLRLFWIVPWIATARRVEGRALLVGLAVLAIGLSIAFGDEWLGLLVYLSVALALALPTAPALAGIAVAAAVGVAIAGEATIAFPVVGLGVLLAGVRRLMELVRELEVARAHVAEMSAREERVRLSRDLHDVLGHNLSLIALKSELARRLIGRDPAAAEGEVRDIESVARSSLQEARAAVQGLRNASLGSELERATEALEAAQIEVEIRAAEPLPARVETVLAFAVREATTNVIRHSAANRCVIAVRRAGDVAELEVRDDGTGSPAAHEDGSGLRGLTERLAEAGGALTAGPAEDGGFRLMARVPIETRPSPAREVEPLTAGQ